MPRKKKSLSRDEVALLEGQRKYEASYNRVLEAIKQMREREGPVYEKWKARMKAWVESLEEEGV